MSFWSRGNWGLAFGVRDALHPMGHRGSDRPGAPHTKIPFPFKGGKVVQVQHHGQVLGNNIVIRTGLGIPFVSPYRFYGFCHLYDGSYPPLGSKLTYGDRVGKMAGPADFHGSAWAGSHVHVTRSTTVTGIYYGEVSDPRPHIIDAIQSTVSSAGTGAVTPVSPPTAVPPKPPIVKDVIMSAPTVWSHKNSTTKKTEFARAFDNGFIESTTDPSKYQHWLKDADQTEAVEAGDGEWAFYQSSASARSAAFVAKIKEALK